MFIISTLVVIGLQAIIIEVGGVALQVVPLDWSEWLFCIAIGVVSFPLGMLLRFVPVPDEPHVIDVLFGRTPPVYRPTRRVRDIELGVITEADMWKNPNEKKERKSCLSRLRHKRGTIRIN